MSLSFNRQPVTGELSIFDNTVTLIWIWVAHILLGLTMHLSGAVANLHALVTLALCLGIALTNGRSANVVYAVAYLAGSEVLWRMTEASVFYEVGKYGTAACFLLALMRFKKVKISYAAVGYFGLLLPSLFTTAYVMNLTRFTRMTMSFHISGPLALAVSLMFFANARLTRKQTWTALLCFVTPVIGIATIAIFGTHTAGEIEFVTESNHLTSGGFGPNQVSATLGLTSTILLLYLCHESHNILRKSIIMIAICVCAMQSALTFSRGGIYAASLTFVASALFLWRDPWARARMAGLVTVILLVAFGLVIPYLMAFTKDKIGDRFSESGLSNREHIMASDLEIWKKFPIYGAGVGLSMHYHVSGAAPHNEFTREIAEHGIFGIAAILILITQAINGFLTAKGVHNRAFTAAMMAWPLLFLGANGFRIVAPAFMFGLGYMRTKREEVTMVAAPSYRAPVNLQPQISG